MALALDRRTEAATVRIVAPADDLQAALTAAQPGDELVLTAGATYTGAFILPKKPFGPAIIIRSAAVLPDRRLELSDAPLLPILQSPTVEPALTIWDTQNWKLDGLRFKPTASGLYNVVWIERSDQIVLDRILFVGEADGQRRVILGNGTHVSLTRSHLDNIWRTGEESQGFLAYNGGGPFTIRDNFIEAASQSVMFGGANSDDLAHMASDVLIEGNTFTKRLEWKGQPRVVKNVFELKAARRVTVRHNLMERAWTDGQNGYGILFTVRNDGALATWHVVEDVLFEQNIVRDIENGFNILGYDGYQSSGQLSRVTIRNNVIQTTGTLLQIGGEAGVIVFDHNTCQNGGTALFLYSGAVWPSAEQLASPRPARWAVQDLTYSNNLTRHYIFGDVVAFALPALTTYAQKYQFHHNVLADPSGGGSYPDGNWFPSAVEDAAQFASDSVTLRDTSWYKRAASDGLDLGRVADTSPTPPDPCTVAPVRVQVKAWPSFVSGQQTQGRWTVTSPVRWSLAFTGASVTVTNEAGCVVTVPR